jgi:FlaA1/EpsC-like NDP-sugar epimerase
VPKKKQVKGMVDREQVMLPQAKRLLAVYSIYAVALISGYFLAYELRFDFNVPDRFCQQRDANFLWVLGLKWLFLWQAGQFKSIMAYFRLHDALRLFIGLGLVAMCMLFLWYSLGGATVAPRSVIITDFLLGFFMIAAFRVSLRLRLSGLRFQYNSGGDSQDVIIVGAGAQGARLCAELMSSRRAKFFPVAFVDDDPKLRGGTIHGVPVAGALHQIAELADRYGVKQLIIAIPHISVKQIHEIIRLADAANLSVQRVEKYGAQVSPSGMLSQIRNIECEDLLGRDPVEIDVSSIESFIRGQVVLITGAGGSIGRELLQQILRYQPRAVVGIDQSELAIFQLRQQLVESEDVICDKLELRVLNIRDLQRMRSLLQTTQPSIIFHAAAHKHVKLMESQPAEALKNNAFATADLAELASDCAVSHFVFISTDKAIKPISVMGASKRMAELAIVAQQRAPANNTQFTILRFGNVMGSSGSVLPLFREQIAKGRPVTVSHPEAKRYFMLVGEAVGLVLESASKSKGAQTFALDMGDPIKILELARQMIRLQGLKPDFDIDIQFTGLTLGEKLMEELEASDIPIQPTSNCSIRSYSFVDQYIVVDFSRIRSRLEAAIQQADVTGSCIKKLMSECPIDYCVAEPETPDP